jgi:Tol biopolymer transport system component
VAGDTNAGLDVFVHDQVNATTERVSVSSTGHQADIGQTFSSFPVLSADGRYVAFDFGASDLVPNDTNGASDVFVRDRTLGTTERVNLTSSSAQTSGGPPFLQLVRWPVCILLLLRIRSDTERHQ